jgi:hypothetical protein
MQFLPDLPGDGEGLLVYLGMLLVWAEALYVFTRSRGGLLPLLAALAMAIFAVYLLGLWEGALSFPERPSRWIAWLRGTWWAACIAPALWLLLTVVLARDDGPANLAALVRRKRTALVALSLGPAMVLAVVGVSTELVLRWSEAVPNLAPIAIGSDNVIWHIPPGPLYGAWELFLLLMLGGAAAIIAWLWRRQPSGTPLFGRFAGLLAAGLLFLVGGAYLAFASGNLNASALPGEAILVAGMLVMGWNVGRYGALLRGEVETRDFRAFGLATVLLVCFYALLIRTVPTEYLWPEGLRWLLVIVMTTHALADPSTAIIDRLVLEPRTANLRARLRDVGNQLLREPDATDADTTAINALDTRIQTDSSDPEQMRAAVDAALKQLNNLPRLAGHSLVGRTPSTRDANLSPMDGALLLRQDLVDAVDRLRPSTPRPKAGIDGPGGWLHYLVLYEAYVDGCSNGEIMQRYFISESTFHRARRSAVNTIAADLYDRLRRSATSQIIGS